ncbi:MAG: hypothetical protein R3C14_53710 [Caldilineaceae bacterium]
MTLLILTSLVLAACGGGAAPAAQATPTAAVAAAATPTEAAVPTASTAMTETTTTTSTAGANAPAAATTMTETRTTTETTGASAPAPSTAMTETTAVTSTTSTSTTTSMSPAGPLVMVHEDATFGQILVDSNGMTLYIFDKDTAGKSTCSGNCLTNWPPLVATSENEMIGADASVTGKLSVIARDDGTFQVAINDMPLYTYAKDTQAGDTNGQAVGDVWWVVGPDGNKITKQ